MPFQLFGSNMTSKHTPSKTTRHVKSLTSLSTWEMRSLIGAATVFCQVAMDVWIVFALISRTDKLSDFEYSLIGGCVAYVHSASMIVLSYLFGTTRGGESKDLAIQQMAARNMPASMTTTTTTNTQQQPTQPQPKQP